MAQAGLFMRRTYRVLLAAFGLLLAAHDAQPQEVVKRAEGILLVVPESDTVTTPSSTYRLSASVPSGWKVFLNGKGMKVYPSGAFDGLLDLNVGENLFTITAFKDAGTTVSKSFVIFRAKPLETTRADTLAIEDAFMEPSTSMWLSQGDRLQVQCKGTPHCRASFFDGIPMMELPPSAKGYGGIYQGVYQVTSEDTAQSIPVVFQLEDTSGKSVTRESRGRISFNPPGFPRVGVTAGDRPSLRYGLANDRLGGTILSTLSPGIDLMITGRVGDLYRVALAEGRQAWIDVGSVELQPEGTHPPGCSMGNWNVYGDDKADYVTINMPERLPYASSQELDPTRLEIEVFGAVVNSNWIIQKNSAREIKTVDYRQTGANIVHITITLNHRQAWGYSIGYAGHLLVIRVRREPEKPAFKNLTFFLDAGHGGTNEGAIGCTGLKEKDVTLSIARHLRDFLEERGAKVVMSRDRDTTIATSERLKKALASDADLLISIHANSIGLTTNPEDTRGVSLFYRHLCFRPLSDCLMKSLLKTGLEQYGTVGGFNFLLNAPTEIPNALVEVAYISNPEDEMKLIDDDFRVDVAKRLVEGIKDFLDSSGE